METAVFKKYENGYYTFLYEKGEDKIFEELHPRVLKQFDLKNDMARINQTFKMSFVEVFDDDDNLLKY